MKSIFYSWQGDLDRKKNMYFIEKSIKRAITNLGKDDVFRIDASLDKATSGLTGSPDIKKSIFDKIDKCSIFIADVSITLNLDEGNKSPNPNVILELGYAARAIGWDKIICFFNTQTGIVEDLPFDLKQNRITHFNPEKDGESKRLADLISDNIKLLHRNGKLFNPVQDFMKKNIDRLFLDIGKKIGNVLFSGISLTDGLSNINQLLNLNLDDIREKLQTNKFPTFLILDTYDSQFNETKSIIGELTPSTLYPKEWVEIAIELNHWIVAYNHHFNSRFYSKYLEKVDTDKNQKYCAISGKGLNSSNPQDSILILEIMHENGDEKGYIDPDHGVVVNKTEFPIVDRKNMCNTVKIKVEKIDDIANLMFYFSSICKKWLDLTDGEFILDPEYYIIS